MTLSELRKAKGKTQQEIACLMNVSIPSISNYETGKREPSLIIMDSYAKALGVEFWEICISALKTIKALDNHIYS